MNKQQIIDEVLCELTSAKKKWPRYYMDIIHAVSLVNEEAGEAIQAALDYTYDHGSKEKIKKELIQAAAMCFRALENWDDLTFFQHEI